MAWSSKGTPSSLAAILCHHHHHGIVSSHHHGRNNETITVGRSEEEGQKGAQSIDRLRCFREHQREKHVDDTKNYTAASRMT